MNDEFAVQKVGGELISIEQQRAIQEVQASLVIAKKFPRDVDDAYLRILKACERYVLADQAEYAYPRGGQTVSGPSIRLAEVLAQNWGNLQFGIRELSQAHGESEIEAFAWDLETNTKQVKTFKVAHKRYTKAGGNKTLSDPRDIYEHTANQGARRMRACILGIIPGDIVDAAVAKCHETVKAGIQAKPLQDQIRSSLKAFDGLGVTKTMIEKRLKHRADVITEDELAELRKIYRSIKDNMTGREEWFDLGVEVQKKAADLTEKIKNGAPGTAPVVKYEAEDIPPATTVDPGPDNGTKNGWYGDLLKARPGASDKARESFGQTVRDNLEAIYNLPKDQLRHIKAKWSAVFEDRFPVIASDDDSDQEPEEAPQHEPYSNFVTDVLRSQKRAVDQKRTGEFWELMGNLGYDSDTWRDALEDDRKEMVKALQKRFGG